MLGAGGIAHGRFGRVWVCVRSGGGCRGVLGGFVGVFWVWRVGHMVGGLEG